MEGEKDFDEEPVDALVSQLIRRGDTYKGKFKKLENAVAIGKTITTTSGTKLVTGKASTPIVNIPSSGQTVTRTAKTSPQTSVMKVVTGKNQSKRINMDHQKTPEAKPKIEGNMLPKLL